jgi:hypothetical protein
MPSCHVHVTATSAAPPSAVFALLADIRTWSEWGAWVSAELEAPAPDGSGGVGAIRRLTSRTLGQTIISRERVEEVVPDRRIVYALLSGLPLEGYRGVIELEPAGSGTQITWSSSFDPKIYGTGWLYQAILRKFIAQTASAVADAA